MKQIKEKGMNSFYTTHIGPVFFDENKKLKYMEPSQNILKQYPQKEEVCSCPLCSGNQFLGVGKISIDEI